ncbi:MAG: SusF/SusE family outer membrane protein [Bacteroidales bacterium]|jgi:hypothetical protein|nr:SusF/SusE family outer membrane protein [Bacteroidales bacterium]
MKNIIKIFSACFLLLLVVVGCKKDEVKIIVPDPSTWVVPVLNPVDTVAITKENIGEGKVTFKYSLADCKQPLALITYSLCIKKGDKTAIVGTSVTDSVEVPFKSLNSTYLDLGVPDNGFSEVIFYVEAAVGLGISKQFVNSAPITSIASAIPSTPDHVYLVGDIFSSSHSWDIGNATYIFFRDEELAADNVYSGYCNAGEFKIVEGALGDWGSTGIMGKGADGELVNPGANIGIATAGFYTITVNTSALSYSVETFATPNTSTYTSVSIIGTGVGGWDAVNDVIMTATDYDPHIYEAASVAINGEVKFRANQDWAVNWGGGAFPYGLCTPGGNNMEIPDGTYYVKLNTHTGHSIFIKQ